MKTFEDVIGLCFLCGNEANCEALICKCCIDHRMRGGSVIFSASGDLPAAPIKTSDSVNHPTHYTNHPSGVECITVTEHMGFCIGNAIKYLWRADDKGNALEDLKKARWYIDREIQRREATPQSPEEDTADSPPA